MPWCATCERWWGPAALGPGGACPACGRTVTAGGDDGAGPASGPDVAAGPDGGGPGAPISELRPVAGAPWHFKLLLVALALYLGFRFWQMIAWVIGRL